MAEQANGLNSAQNITTPPEENGTQNKLFTQEEVNRIVSERLNRERAKAEPSETETRELELAKRESRLNCREFLSENHYSDKLLDILDTSDAERFKETVKNLTEMDDYDRNGSKVGEGGRWSHYGKVEGLSATTEEFTLKKDRSFTFSIDKLDTDETGQQLAAASALARETRRL